MPPPNSLCGVVVIVIVLVKTHGYLLVLRTELRQIKRDPGVDVGHLNECHCTVWAPEWADRPLSGTKLLWLADWVRNH